MCTHTQTHAGREHWRVSVLSEWAPFLTRLSKYPCVNTADQMAERETDGDGGADGESRALHEDLVILLQPYLSLYRSVWPRLTLHPHHHMQQANRSVAMETIDRPRIFWCVRRVGESWAPQNPTCTHLTDQHTEMGCKGRAGEQNTHTHTQANLTRINSVNKSRHGLLELTTRVFLENVCHLSGGHLFTESVPEGCLISR